MSDKERKHRIKSVQELVSQRTIYHWISEQFADIEEIMSKKE